MNLVIDIGNTLIKSAIFKKDQLIHEFTEENPGAAIFEYVKSEGAGIESCLISSVSNVPKELTLLLDQEHVKTLLLDADTPLPFRNSYRTRETLGSDRIAAVAGACSLYPGKDVLIIDAGTAITYEVKTKDEEYLGGNIAPGLGMRFRALHDQTAKLPLLQAKETESLMGKTTEEAILNGVQRGVLFEVNGYIDEMSNKYPELVVLLTGGDSHFFDNTLKKTIFVVSNLTLLGLNFILRYNAEKY